jgi:uncharacterized membrane protein YesL
MPEVLGILTGMLAVILIFGAGPATILLIYYFSRKAKNKERMAMIEKGVDPSLYIKESPISNKVLLFGMLLGGIGLGLLVGYIIAMAMGLELAPIMPILAILFGGFGLIGYYMYEKKAITNPDRKNG